MKHLRLALAVALLTFGAAAHAATFNLFQPASGILVGNPNTYVTSAADADDVIALWSGTCDSTTYLRADGSCAIAGTGTVESVGLTMPSGFSVTGSPITTTGTLAVSTTLDGVLVGDGTGFTTADSADVIELWSGTCDASSFLRGDGSCAAAGGGGSVTSITAGTGLTASPSNPITSTGTLAVDEASNFTWTGVHTFTGNNGLDAAMLSGGTPALRLTETDATADNKNWRVQVSSERLQIFTANDALNAGESVLAVDRTGTTVDAITLGAPTIIQNSLPALDIYDDDAVANRRRIRLQTGSSSFNISAVSDDGSTVNPFISLSTSGTASPATLNLQATNVQVNGSPVCTANGANCPAVAGGTFVTSGSSCGLTNSTGRMSSCTRAGTGLYNMTFSPSMGSFSSITCVATPQIAGGAVNPSFGYVAISSGTAAQLRTFIQNPPGSAAVAFDGGIFYVICHGT